MSDLSKKTQKYAPAYIVGVYPVICEIARKHGYAIALHGSLHRDLDLVAIPWVERTSTPIALIKSICEELEVSPNHDIKAPTMKPHNREAWSIPLWWGAYLDFCVMLPQPKKDD